MAPCHRSEAVIKSDQAISGQDTTLHFKSVPGNALLFQFEQLGWMFPKAMELAEKLGINKSYLNLAYCFQDLHHIHQVSKTEMHIYRESIC